jgi:hypothetical protein
MYKWPPCWNCVGLWITKKKMGFILGTPFSPGFNRFYDTRILPTSTGFPEGFTQPGPQFTRGSMIFSQSRFTHFHF